MASPELRVSVAIPVYNEATVLPHLGARMRDREYLMSIVGDKDITAVVLNRQPAFSPVLPVAIVCALTDRFPPDSIVGQFTARWRE